jgi:hypothetical protein
MPVRARAIVEARDTAARRRMAARLGIESAEPASLIAAMQSPRVVAPLQKLCTSAVMWEDLVLLSANPFDPVESGDLVEPRIFEEAGLIESDGSSWQVNLDLALLLVPHHALEFGFCATLLARLDTVSLARVARAVEVGPRPSAVDYVLDIAEAATNEQRILRQLAFLNETDRAALRDALEAGELPTDLDGISVETPMPSVSVDAGAAGQRGLLFRLAQPARGIESRGVVPLETFGRLEAWLERVPPPPEVVAAKPSAKRPRTTGSQARVKQAASPSTRRNAAESTPESVPRVAPSPIPTPSSDRSHLAVRRSEERRPAHPSTDPELARAARSAQVQPAAGMVDLESPRLARLATRDPDLGEAVLAVLNETFVILREGTDVREWVEAAAARVGFG